MMMERKPFFETSRILHCHRVQENLKYYINNFYCCTVHSEIYIVHSPTNALFIELGKV
jgi:hypothetical protein